MSRYGKLCKDLKLFSYMVCEECHAECIHHGYNEYMCIKCHDIKLPDKEHHVYWLFEYITNYISDLSDADARKAIRIVLSKVFNSPDCDIYNPDLINTHLHSIRSRY